MRKKIVAGNWKMNNDLSETEILLRELKNKIIPDAVSVMVAPTFVNLQTAVQLLEGTEIGVAAQNMYFEEKGAFTGEVSMSMLKGIGVDTVILGHSERRSIFGETNTIIAKKVQAAVNNEMTVIFCFGEELKDRQSGSHFEVVKEQLDTGVFTLFEPAWKNVILAYEPVWAIGTGVTASPEQAQEMHGFIRKAIAERYTNELAENVSILYGGSVKPNNAKEIFNQPDVDGGLIGGAALNADDFMAIVNAF